MPPAGLLDGQRLAFDQLRDLEEASGGAIQLLRTPDVTDGVWRPTLSLDCSGVERAPGGIRIRARERFALTIDAEFPFSIPSVNVTHDRWAGVPHVQWRRHLCLFGAPSIEWDPSDGMNLLIDRLTRWLEAAAKGELDPDDQPLHPPVAYAIDPGVVVVRADVGALAPPVTGDRRDLTQGKQSAGDARLAVGVAKARRGDRLDIVEWMTLSEWLRRWNEPDTSGQPRRACLAILGTSEAAFEYPLSASEVIETIDKMGVSRTALLDAAAVVALTNFALRQRSANSASTLTDRLHVLIGTPSRRSDDGSLRLHFVCWRLDDQASSLAEDLAFDGSANEVLAATAQRAIGAVEEWIRTSSARWVRVLDDRSEVSTRRDAGTAVAWLCAKRVAIFGAGALGGHVAEACVRGGAREVAIVDNDIVTPGVLVRQPFEDDDIGANKANAIAARLNRIREGVVSGHASSAQAVFLASPDPPNFDLIIDASADHTLRCRVEQHRSNALKPWPPMLTMVIGHNAARGVVTMSAPSAAGGGRDLLRRLALKTREEPSPDLDDVADDLFPREPRSRLFHPEPGCSAPTFVGSAAQVSALACGMLDAGLRLVGAADEGGHAMAATAVRIPAADDGAAATTVAWHDDLVGQDRAGGYQVRVSANAVATMRSEVRRGRRLRGHRVETGGTLVGQIDDAARCIWIDRASGPPPDSVLSEAFFDHGTAGVSDFLDHHRSRTGGLTTYVGMWHSHPYGRAAPSTLDIQAMDDMVAPFAGAPRRGLVLILGGDAATWDRWVSGEGMPDVFATLVKGGVSSARSSRPLAWPKRRISVPDGLTTWPGGWRSRPSQIARRRRRGLRWRRLRVRGD